MKRSNSLILLLIGLAGSVCGQQVSINALAANESVLLKKLTAVRKAHSEMKSEGLAAKANEMLAAEGLDFFLTVDSTTCTKVRTAYEAQKDKSKPLKLSVHLQSSGAEKARVGLPDPIFDLDKCSGCYIKLALLEITDRSFVTKVMGANIKFDLPPNLTATEVWLLEGSDTAKPAKRWRIPSRLVPIGLSHDDNVLYLDLNIPELKDISLGVFSEGVFEFVTRLEAEAATTASAISAPNDTRKRLAFTRYGKTSTISYEKGCVNAH